MNATSNRAAALAACGVVVLMCCAGPAPAGDGAYVGAGPVDLRLEYGIALALDNRVARAESVFVSALALSPRDPRALTNLGNLCLMRGDPALALAFYDRAARGDTADAGIRLNRSVALLMGGDPTAARMEARRALEGAGGVKEARTLLGIRGGGEETAEKGGDRPVLTAEEVGALLLAAASSVPSDTSSAVADSLAGLDAVPNAAGRAPTWRSAGPRAAERTGIAPLLYWKR